MLGNVRLALEHQQFWKSLEIFGRQSEIFGKLSKTASSARLYNKKNITRWLEDMNFMFSWQELSAFSLSFLRRRSFVKSRQLWIQRTHTMGFSPSFLSGDGSGGMLPRKFMKTGKLENTFPGSLGHETQTKQHFNRATV